MPTYYHLVIKDPSIVVKGFNLFKAREKEIESLRNGDLSSFSKKASNLNEQQVSRVISKLHELDEWLKTANAIIARYNEAGMTNYSDQKSTIMNTAVSPNDDNIQTRVTSMTGSPALNSKDLGSNSSGEMSAQLLNLTSSFQNVEFILLSRLNKINNELKWLDKSPENEISTDGRSSPDIPDSVLLEKYLADSYGILNGLNDKDMEIEYTGYGTNGNKEALSISDMNTPDESGRESINNMDRNAGNGVHSNPLTPVLNERSELKNKLAAIQKERKDLVIEYQANQQTIIIDKKTLQQVRAR